MLGTSWRLFRVSPLFNLRHDDEAFLAEWAGVLERDLATSKGFEGVAEWNALAVDIAAFPALRGTEDDTPSIRVRVTNKVNGKKVAVVFLCAVKSNNEVGAEKYLGPNLNFESISVVVQWLLKI